MASSPPSMSGSSTPLHQSHHYRRRLKHLIMPDGRKVHIAHSPEEAAHLRQRLSALPPDGDGDFDVVISSSDEHVSAVRAAHAHHETRRQALREQHGDTYDEFERVREDLEDLNHELHLLTTHAVALDASFSKYGYSAHLRTHDDNGGGGPDSGAASLVSADSSGTHDWDAQRKSGSLIKFYRRPIVKQYFHKGLIWRASSLTEVASFELFFDLLFVGILAINADAVGEHPTGYELLRFSITFIMSWKVWNDLAVLVGLLEANDIISRLSVLFIMACLLGVTTQMVRGLEETYPMLVTFYLAARLFMAVYYLALVFLIKMIRATLVGYIVITLIPAALWIGSVHVVHPYRLWLICIALAFDIAGSVLLVILTRYGKSWHPRLSTWIDKHFEFFPALNIEHKTERTNAFVTLVFGYSVVALIYQSTARFGVDAFLGKAVLGLVQSFCFNWIYFELDGSGLFKHAIRRSVWTSLLWNFIHLPFVMAYVLAAAMLSKLVVAHDCNDAHLDNLTEFYQTRSEDHLPQGLRWFYCVGLAIALACMGLINISHVHKENLSGRRNLSKVARMLNRGVVCVILCLLPLADHLKSIALIAITTSLIVWVLFLELWGVKCPKEGLWGRGERNTCRYTARCGLSKKELQSKLKTGEVINVAELSEKQAASNSGAGLGMSGGL